MNTIEGLSVVISGGASGLGAAAAKNFADLGARVAILDLNRDAGEALAAEIGALFQCVDVTSEVSVSDGLSAVCQHHGGVHVALNSAGIAPAIKTISKAGAHDLEAFEKVISVNLIGSFNVSRLVADIMASQDALPSGDKGVIVNTASIAAFDGQVGQVAYAASKGGIVSMTLPMARDLAQNSIRVVTIAPGTFMTPLVKEFPEQIIESLGQSVPYPARLGEPREYAKLTQHIVENTYLNGETIRLDGALRMAPK